MFDGDYNNRPPTGGRGAELRRPRQGEPRTELEDETNPARHVPRRPQLADAESGGVRGTLATEIPRFIPKLQSW